MKSGLQQSQNGFLFSTVVATFYLGFSSLWLRVIAVVNIEDLKKFGKCFKVELATTPEQKERAYRVRYRVYCEELEFEPKGRFPNEIEYDQFDEHSLHCLVIHKNSGYTAGCVRLVTSACPGAEYRLPLERYCSENLDAAAVKLLNEERKSVCEISRLAVDPLFRQGFCTKIDPLLGSGFAPTGNREKEAFPLISVALFLACTALTDLSGCTNVFAIMNAFLPRYLKRFGIYFQKTGPEIEHHGLRSPYFITTQSAFENMKWKVRNLYDNIFQQLESAYPLTENRKQITGFDSVSEPPRQLIGHF